jgi:ribosomal protein L11 methyltransferase
VIRLAVRCRAEHAERVLAELLELVPDGVEEERGGDYVEFAIYGAPGELPAMPQLEAVAGAGLVGVSTDEVPDDWADRWRDFHEPILVADRVWVRPSWAPPAAADVVDLVVEPGQAFGTGAHATTRLCLEMLVEASARGDAHGPLTDLGTGSGVLAICAAKLGWAPVTGWDHERAALEAATANAAVNRVEVTLRRVNLRDELPPCAGAVVANLTAPLLREVAGRLADQGTPPLLVCSGLLPREADEVAAAFGQAGLGEQDRRSLGDWAALSLRAL